MCIRDRSKEEKKSQENEDNKSTQEDSSTEEQTTQKTASSEQVQSQQQTQQPATQEQQQTQQANNTPQTPQQQQNNQNYNQTQQPNQNVKLPKNTEIDDQYIHGEVAEALQRKTEIERQASEDYENGLISEDEAMERDEQASEILNQAVENQYGPQD